MMSLNGLGLECGKSLCLFACSVCRSFFVVLRLNVFNVVA